MKNLCLILLSVCFASGCPIDRSGAEKETGLVILSKDQSVCRADQQGAIKKLGFGLTESVEALISFLLESLESNKLPICTKGS